MRIRYNSNSIGKQEKQALVYTGKEHSIQPVKIDIEVRKIIQVLNTEGYEAYLVGGAVRDLLIGKVPKDFDIATSASPSKIKKIFKNSRIIGKRFRLVHIFFKEKIYEVSTFRSLEDGSIGNKFGTIEEDVRRRDFTCNALYYDPIQNLLIDYVGGIEDIKNNILRPIIPIGIIFEEDPVRMIRAIKYAEITKAKLPFFLKRQIKKNAGLLEDISPSRLTEEINKIFFSGFSHNIVEHLLKFNLYCYLQPAACIFIEESKKFKKKYLDSLIELDVQIHENNIERQGGILIYLVEDYIKLISNKEFENDAELYKYVYKETRHFIMPMNPMRKEMEYAVRTCLNRLGFEIPLEKYSETLHAK